MADNKRLAILWTIVIVFISQLFHCAYTSQGKGRPPQVLGLLQPMQQQQQRHVQRYPMHYGPQQPNHHQSSRETYEEQLLSSGSSQSASGAHNSDNLDHPSALQPATNQQNARERCRELISLTLLSFRDLSPDERATEEIDCANLQERIREAHRSRQQLAPVLSNANSNANNNDDQDQSQLQSPAVTQLPLDSQFPLTPVYSQPQQHAQATLNRQNSRTQQFNQPQKPANLSIAASQLQALGWPPRGGLYAGQMQQLLVQQQRRQQQLYQQQQQQQQMITTTANPPTTTMLATTTFEPQFESTLSPTTTTTTTTTTTPRPQQHKIRPAGGPGKRRQPKFRSTTSTTTTTTTTTTTAKPLEMDYEPEGSAGELSTDYTEYYDEQTTTTTTTTTSRPANHRAGGGRRKPRRRGSTTSTTPKPSTTTTTLSPGYQPRPDGRIIDYMADPNFPRELKGADLTNYPFYISVPEKIDFECKGRHDGYYTNIDLHCQIYHHCAVGNRYDFLCPNYTLFDQTTFTCRFINTVDCLGSTKHFDRNNALYVEKDEAGNKDGSALLSTSTTTTTTTTQAPQQPKINIQLASNRQTNRELTVSALAIVQQARAQQGSISSGTNPSKSSQLLDSDAR